MRTLLEHRRDVGDRALAVGRLAVLKGQVGVIDDDEGARRGEVRRSAVLERQTLNLGARGDRLVVAKIDAFVEKIVDSQMEQGQFLNANITFKEIQSIKKVLKKKLNNIYHLRVEYPE